MKAFADLQRRQLSTAVAPLTDEDFDYGPLPLAKSSRGRLHAVASLQVPSTESELNEAEVTRLNREAVATASRVATNMVIRPAFNNKSKTRRMPAPKLTTEEFIQVRLATVRESTRHCYWPADVVARFAAADVIR